MRPHVLSFFPKDDPYPGQVEALEKIVEVFESGVNTIILEAPVGFGKSPVAVTLAKYYGTAHVLTPRKALQDQYFEDFTSDLVTLKGMSNYPCYPTGSDRANRIAERDSDKKGNLNYFKASTILRSGGTPVFQGLNCGSAPCNKDEELGKACLKARTCPYDYAIENVLPKNIIVSNLHSFIANSARARRMDKRGIMIVDEAHDMRSILRDYLSKTVTVPLPVYLERITVPESDEIQDWVDFFRQEKFLNEFSLEEFKEEYEAQISDLLEYGMRNFVVSIEEKPDFHSTSFKFIPRNLGNSAEYLLLSYGERRLLMSGTIYDKEYFCRSLGLNADEVFFLRMPSTFAPARKPIYMKDHHMTDNSFKGLQDNYPQMLSNIRKAFKVYHDVRGLIHSPSYALSEKLAMDLADSNRVLYHTPENFREVYEFFLNESPPNAVLISPVCYQGVDLKYDRARFQLIVRVPYPNISDAYIADLMKRDIGAYTYEALVIFGQMLGRVMRAPDDWGHTILLDSRFRKFISSYRKFLPQDVLQSIHTR